MKYQINSKLIKQKVGSKTTFFDTEKSLLYTLNETATFILDKVQLGWEEENIQAGLMKKYKISERQVARDVQIIVSDLKKKKILLPQLT